MSRSSNWDTRPDTLMVKIKRVYAPPAPQDGLRILVDRIWPRGISKQQARITEWRKELAPSTTLRNWFGHDPAKWKGFRERYRAELKQPGQMESLRGLAQRSKHRTITLVYAAVDEQHNQAVVLKELLGGLNTIA